MKKQFFDTLCELARSDERVFLVVGDVGFGAVEDFASEFPDRFLNVGVAEQNMATIAAGLASKGFSPFIYSIANFPLLRAFEQVRNDVVHENFPVTIVSIGTGFDYGNLGYSHHSLEDIGAAFALQGLQVYSPGTQVELKETIQHIAAMKAPTYLRLPKSEAPSDLGVGPSRNLEPYLISGHVTCKIGLASYGPLTEKLIGVAGLIESST